MLYYVHLNGNLYVLQNAENPKDAALAAIQTPNANLSPLVLVSTEHPSVPQNGQEIIFKSSALQGQLNQFSLRPDGGMRLVG